MCLRHGAVSFCAHPAPPLNPAPASRICLRPLLARVDRHADLIPFNPSITGRTAGCLHSCTCRPCSCLQSTPPDPPSASPHGAWGPSPSSPGVERGPPPCCRQPRTPTGPASPGRPPTCRSFRGRSCTASCTVLHGPGRHPHGLDTSAPLKLPLGAQLPRNYKCKEPGASLQPR